MIDIPFRLASEDAPLILLQARVNGGEPVDFLLDTGNGAPLPLLVAPSLVQSLDLPKAANGGAFSRIRLHRFELGGYRLENVEAGILPVVDQINARLGILATGNIGYAFLKDWRVGIDYQNKRLGLAPRNAVNSNAGEPFDTGPGGAFILLSVYANNAGPYRFLLDTGASASVISPKLANELGLSGEPIEALGVMGSPSAQLATLDSLSAGGHTVRNSAVAIADVFEYTSAAAGVPVDGIIGYSFLKQFLVEIDYPGRRVHFVRVQTEEC